MFLSSQVLGSVFTSIVFILITLVAVALVTLVERRLLGSMQQRLGPNVVGIGGILQPVCDGLKLFIKENIIPSKADHGIFILAPILVIFLGLAGYSVLPLGIDSFICSHELGLLFLLGLSALGVFGVLLAG